MPIEEAFGAATEVAAEAGNTLWLTAGAIVGGGWLLIAVVAMVALLLSRLLTRRHFCSSVSSVATKDGSGTDGSVRFRYGKI